jgi:hypothetical protein
MRSLSYVVVGGLCLWLGVSLQAAKTPPPPTYITKAEPARCDLIDRVQRKRSHQL